MIDKSRIKSLVAEKHGFVLSDDDPLIVVSTILDVFIDVYGKSLEASFTKLQEEVVKAGFVASQQATQNAEKITIKSLACFHKVLEDGAADIRGAADSLGEVLKVSPSGKPIDEVPRESWAWLPLACNAVFLLINSVIALKQADVI